MNWQFPIALVLAYVVGSVPTGYVIGKLRGVDIREHGSGNIGATNTLRVLGKPAGITALVLDVGKGFVTVTVLAAIAASGRASLSEAMMKVLLGIAAIAGHNWTVFLKFKGGKGVATSAGVFLGIAWVPVLISAAVFAVVVLGTRIVSVGSMSAAVVLPIAMFAFHAEREFVAFGIVAAALVLVRHRANIKRLMRGEENRF
jgi:glycerol-3-phosphate acyltransferase PlsY